MKVIIAIDQSANWRQVIKNVAERHWPKGTIFKILTTIDPFRWDHCNTPAWEKSIHEIREARSHAAQNILSEAKRILETSLPSTAVQTELDHGNAAEHILRTAKEWTADKIVAGARHHSPTGDFGAVPNSLMVDAPCSVELVTLDEAIADDIRKNLEHKVGASK
jgi:nucleotide-binding universal stress UspA family protein